MKKRDKCFMKQQILLSAALLFIGSAAIGCNLAADKSKGGGSPQISKDGTSPKGQYDAKTHTITIGAVSFVMVPIEKQTAAMIGKKKNRDVSLSAYAISRTEVTQALYEQVTGTNPSKFTDESHGSTGQQKLLPVESVSWYDAAAFCNQLTEQTMGAKHCVYTITDEKKEEKTEPKRNTITSATVVADYTKKGFRLPTKAEWEWAFLKDNNGQPDLKKTAWYSYNAGGKTHTVATMGEIPSGLFDMLGNVAEWCEDYYGDDNSAQDPVQTNPPTDLIYKDNKIVKGGCYTDADGCNYYQDGTQLPSHSDMMTGFRIVCRP